MTLIAKEGASTSTSPIPGEFPANGTSSAAHADRKDPLEPPSYSETVAGDAPPAGPSTPLPPASNFNTVFQSNGAIKGTYVVDTSIQVPSALRQPSGIFSFNFKEQENLSLVTRNGSIKASIFLVNGSDQRATVKAQTQNGKLTIRLSRETRQPIKFKGVTRNGSVAISIPRNFIGPIKYKTNWGSCQFAESLQSKVATFSQDTAFVGDWQSAGFKDYKTWLGDEVEVETSNGNIYFVYTDEASDTFGERIETAVEGAVKGVLGWFGLAQ